MVAAAVAVAVAVAVGTAGPTVVAAARRVASSGIRFLGETGVSSQDFMSGQAWAVISGIFWQGAGSGIRFLPERGDYSQECTCLSEVGLMVGGARISGDGQQQWLQQQWW